MLEIVVSRQKCIGRKNVVVTRFSGKSVQNYQRSWLFHIHLKVSTHMYDDFCA